MSGVTISYAGVVQSGKAQMYSNSNQQVRWFIVFCCSWGGYRKNLSGNGAMDGNTKVNSALYKENNTLNAFNR